MMTVLTTNKVALITGGAQRIGASVVRHLHQQGYHIALHYHTSDKAALKLEHELNQQQANRVYLIKANLLIADDLEAIINKVIDWSGRLDVLVNNASVFSRTHLTDINLDVWDNLFKVNVYAPLKLSALAFPWLSKTLGCIVNITDIHGNKPLKDYAVYCQTKAALKMQTKALACEFAPTVRVNAVAPGAIAWPEHDNAIAPDIKEKIIAKTPLKRHGHPLFIAQAVEALIKNNFITGQILAVDGGRSLG